MISFFRILLLLVCVLPARAQTLAVTNDIASHASLTSTAVTITGRAELRLTGTGDVLPGSTVNLVSQDSWLLFTRITPSVVRTDFLSRLRVNGAAAVHDTNVRIVQFGAGAVVIPHAPSFQPLEVFDHRYYLGASQRLNQYTLYNTAALGTWAARIRSFKLKRGYMATFAASDDGTVSSRCYIAQDGDLEISRLPAALDGTIRFVRIFPWRWVGKKGSCDVQPGDLDSDWFYNWNIDRNSPLDWEYVAIKQQPYWPGTSQDWRVRGVNHFSGFNEPDNPVEDAWQNLTPQGSVSNAVARYDELMGTGLRLGAPAVTDGGYNWITDFLNQANTAGVRVDYVPIHYYRSNAANSPSGAASAMYNFLKGIHDVAQRPIWITEFNNGANWTNDAHDPTTAENRDVIEAMIEMMDATPWIERYAVYSNVEWFRDTHYADGSLTPMGQMYHDHVAPIGHRQERRDSEISRTTRYHFDGTAGDDGGSGQDAIAVGTPSYTTGRHGQAIVLDGAHDYLQVPSNVGNSTDFTFAAWVFWNGGGNWQRIFDLGDTTNEYLYLSPRTGSGGMRFAITTSGGGSEQRLDAPVLPTGVWTHVAVTLSGDTGKLFVNGTPVATNTALTINPISVGVKYNYLGRSRFAADPHFNGRLDDVRFLSSALTEAQVAAMAAAVPPSFTSSALTLPDAPVYQPYSSTLATLAADGTGTLTFEKMEGPAWLRVSAAGALTGTPAAPDVGVNRWMVRVTDAASGVHLAELTISVTSSSEPMAVPITAAISSSSNDAEEAADGTVSLTSTDLELTEDAAESSGLQKIGLRFTGLQLPPGALIAYARIQFTADESQSTATTLTIATEAADNATAFAATANNISSRVKNPVPVSWEPAAWTAAEAGAAQMTPNLAGPVQDVVSRSGWQPGNALVFIITGSGHRTAEAFDHAGTAHARLIVTYYAPSPRFTVTTAISSSENDAEESNAGAVDLSSSDLELVADGARGNQTVGLRWPLAVPRDALIDYAAVQFAADEVHSTAASLTFRAQTADNAAAFTATSFNLSSRNRTTTAVTWAPAAWGTIAERGPLQLTPDLSPLVQEIVSRPGWASGNALALLINGTGQRVADAWDDTTPQPAQLTVHYYTEVPRYTYARWALDYPGLGAPDADDDGDGYKNIAEYVLGSDPAGGPNSLPPAPELILHGGLLHYAWHRSSSALDAATAVEWADTLSGPWSSAGVTAQIIADDGTLRTELATMPAGASRRFVRLRMWLP